MTGTRDRKDRILDPKNGVFGTSSRDLVWLSFVLMGHSKEYAQRFDGNVSIYAVAGIPVLFSALRALLIEANNGIFGIGAKERLNDLVAMNEIKFLEAYYPLRGDLKESFRLAYEVRNEIAHPSHLPAGTETGTPEYLSELRNQNLLQSGIWMSQLQSHKLYFWVSEKFEKIAELVIHEHHSDQEAAKEHLESWQRYRVYML